MIHIKRLVRRIASSPASTVLLTGESGTGKNVVARAIHAHSSRASHRLMTITCSALPETLLESELFGHERGAFTDARTRRVGLLEEADGGTVLLDEIGEMAPSLQAKLLGFLEQRAFRRLGGACDLHADVRIVAATNVDLRRAVANGTFREDLYYRLAVLTVHLPPLRDRRDDIEVIARAMLAAMADKLGARARAISPDALLRLRRHAWPGNVRELRNAIERAVLLCDRDELRPEDFATLGDTAPEPRAFHLPPEGVDLRELERRLLREALDRAHWNYTRTGELLGLSRDQVRHRVRSLGWSRPQPRHGTS